MKMSSKALSLPKYVYEVCKSIGFVDLDVGFVDLIIRFGFGKRCARFPSDGVAWLDLFRGPLLLVV